MRSERGLWEESSLKLHQTSHKINLNLLMFCLKLVRGGICPKIWKSLLTKIWWLWNLLKSTIKNSWFCVRNFRNVLQLMLVCFLSMKYEPAGNSMFDRRQPRLTVDVQTLKLGTWIYNFLRSTVLYFCQLGTVLSASNKNVFQLQSEWVHGRKHRWLLKDSVKAHVPWLSINNYL